MRHAVVQGTHFVQFLEELPLATDAPFKFV
jgi:hypothetical protein